MQFAFTEEQELLRREARDALANGGWSRDEIGAADLSFVDKAVLFEEAGRAGVGESLFDEDRPEDERLATLALEAVGIGKKALDLAIEYAKDREQFGRKIGVYQAVSHQLADTFVETELARSLAYWAAWCVAEDDEQAPIATACREVVCVGRRGCRVRALDPGSRRHRLHLGARAPRVLQACALDPGVRRPRTRAPRPDRLLAAGLTRTAIVTGASSGIGEACAVRLARAGWRVLAGVRREGDAPEGTEEVLLDVTDAEQIRGAAERVDELDGLVNNAGIALGSPLELVPVDQLRYQLEVNLVGQVAVTQALLPALRRAKGRIVFMGSIAGRSALPFLAPYAASKHALEAVADSLRLELKPFGISVSIVEPGSIRTAIWWRSAARADELAATDGLGAGRALRRTGRRVQERGAETRRRRRARRSRCRGRRGSAHRRAAARALPGRKGREAARGVRASPRTGSATESTNECCSRARRVDGATPRDRWTSWAGDPGSAKSARR